VEATTTPRWYKIFTPPIVAALASIIPSLLAAAWKVLSPGYACSLTGSVWDSPCFAVSWVVACMVGWLAGFAAERIGRRAEKGQVSSAGAGRAARTGRILAGLLGFILGIPMAGYVLNPCP